jgi:hypothetical protein
VRKAVWVVPERLQPSPKPTVWVAAIDATGRVVRDLQTEHPHLSMVTSAVEHRGLLYLGCLTHNTIGIVRDVGSIS